jgi:multiple sugar transport system substrate-binding protein
VKAKGILLLASAMVIALLGGPAASGQPVEEQATCKDVPNRYDQPFSVCDDEFFIFAANYKPLENSVTEERSADRVWNELVGNQLKAAFPEVKIKYATWDYPVRYEDLKAAGVVPDLIIEDPRTKIDRDLEPLGWVQDMTGLVDQAGIDLGQLNPASVELAKSRSDGGLYGVPVFVDDYLLLYNKKIFDKFKVPYPTNGMTYDKVYKLAEKLTRQSGRDAYKGYMQHPDQYLDFNQLGLYPFLPTGSEEPKPADIKVDMTSEGWQQLGSNLQRFLWIPRNNFTTVDDFLKGDMSYPGHVAMAVSTLGKVNMYALNELYIEDGEEENYAELAKSIDLGIASVPVLSSGSQTTYQPNTRAAFIPPQSTKQDTGMAIVKWLVSEEGQVALSRHGVKGVLETPAVVDAFGADIPELANIDTSAVYWGDNAVVKNYSNTEYWDIPTYRVFRQHVLKDGMTVDTALDVTEVEDIPAYIASKAGTGQDW